MLFLKLCEQLEEKGIRELVLRMEELHIKVDNETIEVDEMMEYSLIIAKLECFSNEGLDLSEYEDVSFYEKPINVKPDKFYKG